MTIRKKFSIFDDREIEPKDRLDMVEKSKKDLPSVYQFGDAMEHRLPIARCVYCGQPAFEIKRKADGSSIASCNTPACFGNQNTPEIYVTAKRKMDEKLQVRNGVWVK